MEAQKPNTPQKPVAAKSKTEATHKVRGIKNAFLVILCCFVIAVLLFIFWFGDASHFENGHPIDLVGTIYKGGVVVPIIQTLLLTVITLSIERYFTIRSAFGRGKLAKFVANIKDALAAGDLQKAHAVCDKQRGSVANVVTATLVKYAEVENNNGLTKEQKVLAIQKELED